MSARIRPEGVLAALVVSALLTAPSARAQTCPSNNFYFWSTYLGGVGVDTVNDLLFIPNSTAPAGTPANDILLTGQTKSSTSGDNTTLANATAFIARMAPNGRELRWVKLFDPRATQTTSTGARMALRAMPDGGVYVVGRFAGDGTQSASKPFGDFRAINSPMGLSDAFLARWSPDGTPDWVLFLGGTSDDEALGLSMAGDAIYVVGRTASGLSFRTGKLFGTPGSGYDAFVTKVRVPLEGGIAVDPIWTRIVGASGASNPDDAASAVVAVTDGVYLGGVIGGDVLGADSGIDLNARTVSGFQGTQDGFVLRLDTDGNVKWMVNLGAKEGATEVSDLLKRTEDDLLVVGDTSAQDFIATNTSKGTTNSRDVFAYALNSKGEAIVGQQTRLTVPGNQRAQGRAALDMSGKVFIGGSTDEPVLNLNNKRIQERVFDDSFERTGGDGFVVLLDPSTPGPDVSWGSYLGGSTSDEPESVTAVINDPMTNLLVVAGNSSATDVLPVNPGAPPVYQPTAPALQNGVLFGRLSDPSPPTSGSLDVGVEEGKLKASWSGFEDPETGLSGYEWSILKGPERVQDFAFVKDTSARADTLSLVPGERYTVELRAVSGGGCKSPVLSKSFVADSSGGGGGPKGGGDNTPGGENPEKPASEAPRSPLGWTCGVTASGAPLSGLGLATLLLLASRSRRRPRGSVGA